MTQLMRWELSGLQQQRKREVDKKSPSMAAEAALFLVYCGNPFYSYPHKPLLCLAFGSPYERAYRHFRAAHSRPLNIVLHLVCLVYAVLANSALLCQLDRLFTPEAYPAVSLLNLTLAATFLWFHTAAAPLPARLAALAVLAGAFGLRDVVLDNWQVFLWLEGVMYSFNVKLSDAKAVPALPGARIAVILSCRYACQWLFTSFCLGAVPALPINVLLGTFIVIGSVRPFHHHFNCYWWGYLGWIAALLSNQAWPYLLGAGFVASLHQGVAHELCKEQANLPQLAAMSGDQRAGDELGHVTFFPVLIFHSAYQSTCEGVVVIQTHDAC